MVMVMLILMVMLMLMRICPCCISSSCYAHIPALFHYPTRYWHPGDPIPGSCAWRSMVGRSLGPEEFFRRQMGSENSMLAFLRVLHSDDIEDASRVMVDPRFIQRCLNARPYMEQLAKSFGMFTADELLAGTVDFQQVGA